MDRLYGEDDTSFDVLVEKVLTEMEATGKVKVL